MTINRELDEILAEIGREQRAKGAPEELEAVLFAAAEKRKRAFAVGSSGLSSGFTAAAAAILIVALATAGVIWQVRKRPQAENQHAQSAPVPEVRAEVPPNSASVGETTGASTESARAGRASAQPSKTGRDSKRVRAGRRAEPQKRRGWNSLDEFVALPVSEGLAPAANLSVVRVKLRGSDLQQYGLEEPADAAARTMLAEFVIGDDGLPRAIRIVR